MSDKISPPRKLTVVYEFTCPSEMKAKSEEIQELFGKPEGAPVRVVASGCGDDMTKLELIEFAHEMGDMDLVRCILTDSSIQEYLELFHKVQAHAAENNISANESFDLIGNY